MRRGELTEGERLFRTRKKVLGGKRLSRGEKKNTLIQKKKRGMLRLWWRNRVKGRRDCMWRQCFI